MKKEAIQEAIRNILNEINSGFIFDTHFVIDQLISLYSDEYLDFACSVNASDKKTSLVHGFIGKEIDKFVKEGLIENVPNESWSKNIHGKASKCTAWKKIK